MKRDKRDYDKIQNKIECLSPYCKKSTYKLFNQKATKCNDITSCIGDFIENMSIESSFNGNRISPSKDYNTYKIRDPYVPKGEVYYNPRNDYCSSYYKNDINLIDKPIPCELGPPEKLPCGQTIPNKYYTLRPVKSYESPRGYPDMCPPRNSKDRLAGPFKCPKAKVDNTINDKYIILIFIVIIILFLLKRGKFF